jgi:saccharopine dehydrogenase-like NADP-dependent oxidoreductase
MRVAIAGCGTVGARAARQLMTVSGIDSLALFDIDPEVSARLNSVLGSTPAMTTSVGVGSVLDLEVDVVLVATPATQADLVRQLTQRGTHVVSTTDSVSDVRTLLALDDELRERNIRLIIGAGFSPGLTDVLASHAATEFEVVDEIHVAKLGTAGPACARQHHAALSQESLDWRDGSWISSPGGSGRELCWFPDPIGGADCYRAALPEALLLHRLFPAADRLTARMSATRRDRLTARLPMLRKPHAEAGPGAVRTEVRGRRDGVAGSVVLASMDRASVATGAVAALAVDAIVNERTSRTGAGGLSEFVRPVPFLTELARRGVKCARFEGTDER